MNAIENYTDEELKRHIQSVSTLRGLKKTSPLTLKILNYIHKNNLFNRETSIQTYIHYIRNDIRDITRCVVCHTLIPNLAKGADRIQKFCSKKCQGLSQITGNWPEKVNVALLTDTEVVAEIKQRITCKNMTKSPAWNERLSRYIQNNTKINPENISGEEKIHIIKRDITEIPLCTNCNKEPISIVPIYSGRNIEYRYQKLCQSCSNRTSTYELKIQNMLKNINVEYIANTRKVLNNHKELDLYIPSCNIAIEVNGLYWYSEQQNDYNKLKDCEQQNIKLIQIFTDEIDKSEKIIYYRLRNIFKKVHYKVGARECIVKEITSKTKNTFLNKYHIQGTDKSQAYLGLYYKKYLVSVMTFAKPRMALGYSNDSAGMELSRFASINSFYINGAASKLFQYYIKNYVTHRVFSYCDLRWSQGNVYKQLGFKLVKYTKPNYWYCLAPHYKERFHRFNWRKSVLKNKLLNFDNTLTEVQNMQNHKHYRVFDSGHLLFEYIN